MIEFRDCRIEERDCRGSRSSEREGRVIDHDGGASMEQKKQEGYF
jgi:sulfate adenylyltransferase subunit 2